MTGMDGTDDVSAPGVATAKGWSTAIECRAGIL